MQRCPLKESGFIKQQTDNDDGDKCRCRVPDDIPDDGNIIELDDAAGIQATVRDITSNITNKE